MSQKIYKLIEPEIHLQGDMMSPRLLHSIENIEFRAQTELGEIMTRGRYKGRSSPYGACQLLTPSYIETPDRIMWMAEFLFMHKQKFVDAGADDIMLWIYWSGMQGGMSFTSKELKMISKSNVPLCIDYIKLSEKDEQKYT